MADDPEVVHLDDGRVQITLHDQDARNLHFTISQDAAHGKLYESMRWTPGSSARRLRDAMDEARKANELRRNDMTERTAQENPAQPAGWAQDDPVNPNAHPNGELEQLIDGQRADTAQWEDAQNRSPIDNVNPAQPPGFAVPAPSMGPIPGQGADAIVARVFVSKTAGTIVGGKVILADDDNTAIGEVVAVDGDEFGVKWRDDESRTWEAKRDYELVVRDDEDTDEE